MPSLAVAAHEEHLVGALVLLAALAVERLDVVGEALPLGLPVVRIEPGICGVGPVDETKVEGGLCQAKRESESLTRAAQMLATPT